MASAIEKVIEIAANNLFDNASVQTCLTAVTDLSNNLDTRVTAVIDGAPGALDTLNELAAALGDDANYAATVTTSLATKYSAGSDASFNDLSANDVSGVNFFTTGGSFVGNLVGNVTAHTVTAQNYAVGGTNFISASRQGNFRDLEVKDTNNTATILLTGDGGDMSLEGTLTVDTINEKTDASGVTIDSVILKDNTVTAHTVTAQNYAVGSTNFVSASRQGNFRDLEVKDTNNSATILLTGDGGDMSLEGTLTVDTINEKTGASGVTIDGVLLKDGGATFTGDVSGNDASFNVVDIHTLNLTTSLTKSDVGLGNVDNTTDVGKPVSTAQQTALDLKANLAGPTFTGKVTMSDVSANDGSFNMVDIAALKVNGVSITQNGSGGASLNINSDISINAIDAQDASFNTLRTSGTMSLGGHILPTSNAQYDLGSAEYKIRHLFLSDNSLWIGDNHKIDISGGKMKFKKRKNDKVPGAVTTAGGDQAGALAHAGVGSLTEMTLQKWYDYAVSLDGALGIQDLFGNDKPDEFDTDRDLLNAVQLPTKSDAGAPATTPSAGTMVFNTNDNKLYIYNGSAWRSVDTAAV
jgi:carbon monoxide dehydrogenase subunit G